MVDNALAAAAHYLAHPSAAAWHEYLAKVQLAREVRAVWNEVAAALSRDPELALLLRRMT